MDDCETGDLGYRAHQHRVMEVIHHPQHVTYFCRSTAKIKRLDGRRFDDSINMPKFHSSFFNRDSASFKSVLYRRGSILVGVALLFSFLLLQHTLVNQSKFLYEIHLQQRRSIFLEQVTSTRTPSTMASTKGTVVSNSSFSIRKLAENNIDSKNTTQRTATSAVTIIGDDDTTDSVVCWPWNYNSSDDWWTHHPTWKRSRANDTHYCYQKIQNERQAALYQALYDVQFRKADCQKIFRRHMWSSGLGADFINVNRGLFQAVLFQRPFQITDFYPWHYAAGKGDNLANESMAACPSRDIYCYFLPLSACPVGEESSENETLLDTFYAEDTPLILPTNNNDHDDNYRYQIADDTVYQWIFEYATRPQTWLWRKVYEYKQSRLNLTTPCMVMHVRRADVIHHSDGNARRYFSIAEYVNASKRANIIPPYDDEIPPPNIFLITDDANAIGEALTEFPTFNWMYIRRKRYKADEGGWEEQTPSRDYVFEMTTLLSILELAPQCSAIVHGQSSFADLVVRSMESHPGGRNLRIARVDDNIPIYDATNSQFRNVSKEYHHQVQEQHRRR
ncbi:hypothetical protein IV203_018841 [Nitzschia inconspicua]|uniref:Uncharacterized protein n=1 Tax=Nitzschia inconspicua TaxID=303405 RepID=A0A9K3M1U6_9STRA|nr:hypothetical protein IV203_018841 [Nitzschia inconspicua]